MTGSSWVCTSQGAAEDLRQPCIAPEFVTDPGVHLESKRPFLTRQGLSLLELPATIEHACDLYCRVTIGGRLEEFPTVRRTVDGVMCRQEFESWKDVRQAVIEAGSGSMNLWSTFILHDLLLPDWWPGRSLPELCVPGYDQLILTQGACAGIGIHQDVQPVGGSQEPIVTTCLTILQGRKYVILLPPNCNIFEQQDQNTELAFPVSPSKDVLDQIQAVGGFFFELAPVKDGSPVTLCIPQGWWHWLECSSEWSLTLTASFYDGWSPKDNHTGHNCTDPKSPCRNLRFEVVDVDGGPLQDAFVELVDSDGFRIARATTDASGYVRFVDISSGQQLQVRVLKRGHASVIRRIIVR